ncbi:MAG: DUF5652 family protein [Minisyncoccia bacterium]
MPLADYMFRPGEMSPLMIVIIIALTIWSLTWKGLALWKSSHNESRIWFVILLVINTFGILELIYYYLLDKGDDEVCVCDTKCVCVSETEEKK